MIEKTIFGIHFYLPPSPLYMIREYNDYISILIALLSILYIYCSIKITVPK